MRLNRSEGENRRSARETSKPGTQRERGRYPGELGNTLNVNGAPSQASESRLFPSQEAAGNNSAFSRVVSSFGRRWEALRTRAPIQAPEGERQVEPVMRRHSGQESLASQPVTQGQGDITRRTETTEGSGAGGSQKREGVERNDEGNTSWRLWHDGKIRAFDGTELADVGMEHSIGPDRILMSPAGSPRTKGYPVEVRGDRGVRDVADSTEALLINYSNVVAAVSKTLQPGQTFGHEIVLIGPTFDAPPSESQQEFYAAIPQPASGSAGSLREHDTTSMQDVIGELVAEHGEVVGPVFFRDARLDGAKLLDSTGLQTTHRRPDGKLIQVHSGYRGGRHLGSHAHHINPGSATIYFEDTPEGESQRRFADQTIQTDEQWFQKYRR